MWTACDRWIRRHILLRIRVAGTVPIHIAGLRFRYYAACDDSVADSIFKYPENYSEYRELCLFVELAKRPGAVIDVGAITGLYSIAARLANENNPVIAFEPYQINHERLSKNLEINKLLHGTTLVQKAVGNAEGTISFEVPANDQVCDVSSADLQFTHGFYRKWLDYKTIEVPQTTLTAALKVLNVSDVGLIKIDVENFELPVLEGSLPVLEASKPILMVEMFVDAERVAWYEQHLKPMGYHCYLISQTGIFRSDTLEPNPDCGNVLFSPHKSERQFLSFSEMPELLRALAGA